MIASIIIYFDQVVSIVSRYPKQVATECLPLVVGGLIVVGVGGFIVIKIWSRILSVEGREQAKPIAEE